MVLLIFPGRVWMALMIQMNRTQRKKMFPMPPMILPARICLEYFCFFENTNFHDIFSQSLKTFILNDSPAHVLLYYINVRM